MKTICPHCNQEFPELPDSYLGMMLECPTCNKQFVCEKAKFCSECGAVNPARTNRCVQCRKLFVAPPPIPSPRPMPPPPQAEKDLRSSGSPLEPDDDCYEDEVGLFTAWRRIGDFSGRACRKEYILYNISLVLVWIAYAVLCGFTSPGKCETLGWMLGIATFLISLSLYVRRMHDIGNSGWWLFLFLLLPPITLTAFCVYPSQPGENKWGENPVGVPSCVHYGVGQRIFSLLITLFLVIAVPIGIGCTIDAVARYRRYRADEELRRCEELCRENLRKLAAESSYIYHGAEITSVHLSAGPEKNHYTGRVCFTRNGRPYERPIEVQMKHEKASYQYGKFIDSRERLIYKVITNYKENSDFLLQDADIFFDKMREEHPEYMSGLRLVGIRILRPCVIRYVVTDGWRKSAIDIEVIEKTSSIDSDYYYYSADYYKYIILSHPRISITSM